MYMKGNVVLKKYFNHLVELIRAIISVWTMINAEHYTDCDRLVNVFARERCSRMIVWLKVLANDEQTCHSSIYFNLGSWKTTVGTQIG